MPTHRIKLPYGPMPYLHANQRLHRMAHARRVATVRRDVGYLAKMHHVGTGHPFVTVGLEWRPKVRRARDGNENLGPLVKACVDGLIGVGVARDDVPEVVTRTVPVLLPVGEGEPGMWLVVETP